jgi:SAM-dependent methyltransferase
VLRGFCFSMTLDIGPGVNVQPHEDRPIIRLDNRHEIRPTVAADARSLPFADGSFSVVYASHILEHFHYRETSEVVGEWIRVLRPGGELQLFVPNLEWIAQQIMVGICDIHVLHSLYGGQFFRGDLHQTGFTPATLKDLLAQFPLENIFLRTFRNNICSWARKATLE